MIFIACGDILEPVMKKSKIAKSARQDLVEACKKMTPVQRLYAFMEHSQALAVLSRSGKAYRAKLKKSR